MNRVRRWIAARLWRRLAFSHFAIIFVTLLILQLAVAGLVAVAVRGTAPVEGDAGWLALQFASAIGWAMDNGHEEQVPLVVDMLQGQIVLPGDVEHTVNVPGFYLKTGDEPIERLTNITVLDGEGKALLARGEAVARDEYRDTWDRLVGLALAGETNPYKLGRWLRKSEGGLLLGTAAITRSDGQIVGAVAVEMYPSLRMETSGAAAPMVGFVGFLLVTGLLGLPALLVAGLVAGLSGAIVSRSLGRRLQRLEETAQEMAAGNLALRVDDDSPDEIGRVGQAFNRMTKQLAHSLHALEGEKEQVEALLRARRDLVANISHDLRTPVASLAAHLETLAERPERLNEYLPILSDEAARMSGLLADLFELARLDARELKLELEPVVMAGVVDKVVASYRPVAWEQRRVVLEANLPAALPPVRADAQRLEQILVNLVTNGLRFTPEGGVVTIEAQALADAVEVRVSDTGIGIPPEELGHIFERSYRGDRARAQPAPGERLSSGSGLGLSIVKGLVEAMDGSVRATSVPGEGTCIAFRLPADSVGGALAGPR
jgi:signal transduction histidine kinase